MCIINIRQITRNTKDLVISMKILMEEIWITKNQLMVKYPIIVTASILLRTLDRMENRIKNKIDFDSILQYIF